MKKTRQLTAVAAVLVTALTTSAFAETRHRNETDGNWRGDGRRESRYDRDGRRGNDRYDRDSLRGYVERVDYRRGTVLLRDERSNRRVNVVMAGGRRERRGVDLGDLRRGDFVTFVGDWERGGLFEAYRIEGVRNGRRW